MHLSQELPDSRVLISVKTYPLPSDKYDELVCTAGFLPDGTWIRVYPIPFRALPYASQYEKYHWIELGLIKNSRDFRPESYRPTRGIEEIIVSDKIGTENDWAERKRYALKEVFTSMGSLIELAKGDEKKSLATLKPREIIDFVVEPDEREWKPQWRDQLRQYNLFDLDSSGQGKKRTVIPKLPYKYSYKFLSEKDKQPRKMMIEDWEIGALYWNCFRRKGSEVEANQLVKKKYFDDFCSNKDLYFFVGTTLQYQLVAPNPFVIIGVFYPPRPKDGVEKKAPPSILKTDSAQQQKFDF